MNVCKDLKTVIICGGTNDVLSILNKKGDCSNLALHHTCEQMLAALLDQEEKTRDGLEAPAPQGGPPCSCQLLEEY